MKSAEEWVSEQSNSEVRVGSFEHKTMCDAVKEIQLDAWRQGMIDAAEIQLKENGMMSCTCCRRADEAIRKLRDSKTP